LILLLIDILDRNKLMVDYFSHSYYPFDYCYTRLAGDVVVVNDGRKSYEFKNARDVLSKTLKYEGVRGVYRGFFISYLGIVFQNLLMVPLVFFWIICYKRKV